MSFLFTNNAVSTLVSGITAIATTLTVQSGNGALFPAPTGGDSFRATLSDASNNIEIIDVTNVTGDVFTMTRAQEGTIGLAYLAGDNVQLRVTKEILDTLAQITNAVMRSGAAIKTAGDLTFNDNVQINLGTALDAEIYSTGAVVNFDLNGGVNLILRDVTTNRFTFDISTGDLTITGIFTATGNISGANITGNNHIVNAELILNASYSENANSFTVTAGTKILDTAVATYFYSGANMLANAYTFQFNNPAVSGRVTSFTLEMRAPASATSITWPTGVDWANNNLEPVWSSGKDIVTFVTRDAGVTWLGFLGGQAYP